MVILERELQEKPLYSTQRREKKEVCSAYVERVSEKSSHIAINGIESVQLTSYYSLSRSRALTELNHISTTMAARGFGVGCRFQ
jgi:hypothetical protein